MQILAIETSGDVCSVALGGDGRWLERRVGAGQAHSELLLPMVDALLAEAGWRLPGLDGIAFGAGPGSFTGLRIACGVVQGLAWGAAIPVVPIGSLLALAEATGHPRVVGAIDARMHEIYVAAYARDSGDPVAWEGGWHEVLPPTVTPPADAPVPAGEGWFGAGNAFRLDPALAARTGCTEGVDAGAMPTARAVAVLGIAALRAGLGLPPDQAVPVYVRDRVALTVAERAARIR